jgi:two-component system nitrate/nitrite response regulator NarL
MIEQFHAEWRLPLSSGLGVALLVDNECVRQGLTVMLRSLAIVDQVYIWDYAAQIFAAPPELDFDILILRFADLDVDSTGQLAKEIWEHGKKILLLLNHDGEDALDAVISLPCNGFLVQDELTSAALATTLSRVTDGDTPMPAMLTNRLLTRAREEALKPASSAGSSLTPRERETLELLVEGLSNKQIARRLCISQHGVKRLVSNVLAKLNCPNRTQAVAIALTDGIITRG